ncbi:MAG: MerR family transcriptional regulator [Bifidobacteriaceae bacterium]|jgi:DNA-binding transcriptional MerR regulator|nr:MerR family transcriptional regulator [Bifidobacteriaceae bacterium]
MKFRNYQIDSLKQGELFALADPFEKMANVGYKGPQVCQAVGITFRQLDYWTTTGLVTPSIRVSHKSGVHRLYSFKDIVFIKLVAKITGDLGISLQKVRTAINKMKNEFESLKDATIVSDGTSVYACRSKEEVYDILRGGQGVFSITLDGIFQDVELSLANIKTVDFNSDLQLDEFSKARQVALG